MQSFRRIRRPIVLLLVALLAPACASWKPTTLAPADTVAAHKLVRFRVRSDGRTRTELVYGPAVQADTVRGRRMTTDGPRDSVAIPLASVERIEVRKFSTGKTVLASLGVLTLGMLIAAGIAASSVSF